MPFPGEMDFESTMQGVLDSGKLDGEDPPSPSPAPSPKVDPPAPGPSPEPSPPPPPPSHPYPKSWKPDFAPKWETADPDLRAEVLRREEDFHKGLTPYRALAEKVKGALAPVAELVQSGQDPFELFSAFGNYHKALSNPKTAVEAFRFLMADYGITAEALSAEAPYVHPQIAALQEQLGSVQSRLSTQDQAVQQAHLNNLRSTITQFAADPANEHFEAVGGKMATLLRADPRLTLKDAYDQACWLEPEVRAKVLKKQAAADAETARKAAEASQGSARTNARSAPATGAVGSMDDTMRATLKAIEARG